MNRTNANNYSRIVQLFRGIQEFLEQQRDDFNAIGISWEGFRPLFFNQSKTLMGLYAEMIVAAKLEHDGHDVYSHSLRRKADREYWKEAYMPEAKKKGKADLYVKDLQKWVEVKISKSYASPQGTSYSTKRPFFLWTWNHLSIRDAAKKGKFEFLVLIGINSLYNYLGKPEDFFYWILNREEALQIESLGVKEREKGLWFYLADDPDKIKDLREIRWAVPIDFHKKQYRQCKRWSKNPDIRVTYEQEWIKIQ